MAVDTGRCISQCQHRLFFVGGQLLCVLVLSTRLENRVILGRLVLVVELVDAVVVIQLLRSPVAEGTVLGAHILGIEGILGTVFGA